MKIKGLIDEDFINYKNPSMFIGVTKCDWKCCIEQGMDITLCQNSSLSHSKEVDMSADDIFSRYINNPLTESLVLGGLEPFLQFNDIYYLIKYFRKNNCDDDFVIYTGYYKNEIANEIKQLLQFNNIIVKYGRYIPGEKQHFDNVLGVYLASNNQYAERIS